MQLSDVTPVISLDRTPHLVSWSKSRRFGRVAAVFVVLWTLALGTSSLIYPFGRDQGEYATIAWRAINGQTIYSDIFNIKPPLTHLVHALALQMFGHSMLAIRWLDLLWQTATAVTVFYVANRLSQDRLVGALAGSLYALWYYGYGYWDTAQTDGWLTLPAALGVLAFLVAEEQGATWAYFASGVLVGSAVLFKYPIGLLALLFMGLLLWQRKPLHRVVVIGVGLSVPVVLCGLSLARQGALQDYIITQIKYVTQYTGGHTEQGYVLSLVYNVLRFSWHNANFKLSVALFVLAGLYALTRDEGRRALPILLWWSAAAASLILQNKFYLYHELPLLAPQAVLAALLVFKLLAMAKESVMLRAMIVGVVIGCLLVSYFLLGYPSKHATLLQVARGTPLETVYQSSDYGAYGNGFYSMQADLEVARYVETHSHPDDQIVIWGHQAPIYFLSQRSPASRFIYNMTLYGDWAWPELREQFVSDLQRSQPLYIVIVRDDAIPWVTGTRDDSATAFVNFDRFYQFVTAHYQAETVIENFTLYRRHE